MTATFFLVRHAAHSFLDRGLAGRKADIHLNAEGLAQAKSLARRLEREQVTAVHSSPCERAVETAKEIASSLGTDIVLVPAIDEIDCGEWTGLTFEELGSDPRWLAWNTSRSTACAPQGEAMADVQERVTGYLSRQSGNSPEGRIVAVTHADVIKAALFACLGVSLDQLGSIEISPAHVSTVVIGEWGSKILSINEALA